MKFELMKHNISKVMKVLQDVKGKLICINDCSFYGVKSVEIAESALYYGDPIPEENNDGGKQELIEIGLIFDNGKAVQSFDPKLQHCSIILETDELWVIQIMDLKKYLENEKFDLDYKLQEYDEAIKD